MLDYSALLTCNMTTGFEQDRYSGDTPLSKETLYQAAAQQHNLMGFLLSRPELTYRHLVADLNNHMDNTLPPLPNGMNQFPFSSLTLDVVTLDHLPHLSFQDKFFIFAYRVWGGVTFTSNAKEYAKTFLHISEDVWDEMHSRLSTSEFMQKLDDFSLFISTVSAIPETGRRVLYDLHQPLLFWLFATLHLPTADLSGWQALARQLPWFLRGDLQDDSLSTRQALAKRLFRATGKLVARGVLEPTALSRRAVKDARRRRILTDAQSAATAQHRIPLLRELAGAADMSLSRVSQTRRRYLADPPPTERPLVRPTQKTLDLLARINTVLDETAGTSPGVRGAIRISQLVSLLASQGIHTTVPELTGLYKIPEYRHILHLPPKQKRLTQEDNMDILRRHDLNEPHTSIAQHYQISTRQVLSIIKKAQEYHNSNY